MQRVRASRWVLACAVAGGALLLSPVVALAQKEASLPEKDNGLIQWAVAAGIVILIAVVAFLNPKRSHLG
ncbi:MAG TPA: hypothetical protein PKK06_02605 [Phycisphaerae bacterium]|nr:hypothetical protein [Phycisphaerae bacterium]HNU44576.1 hypothetical protein [Phycisphaerae bacterium]